jgi:GTPase SAR1 family protein
MGEFLFLGPKGSGKTLLLRRLQTLAEEKKVTPFDPITVTPPTDGFEQITFRHHQAAYVFKELGGSGIQNWAASATSALGLVYVLDAADLTKTAPNIVWLNEVLNDQEFETKPILVVLAKCDVPDGIRFNVVDEIIGLDYVLNPERVTLVETSAVVGVGLDSIFQWVAEQVKPS